MVDTVSDSGAGIRGTDHDLDGEMRREFLDEAEDDLRALEGAVEECRVGRLSVADLLGTVRRTAFPIRSKAGSLGLRLMSTVAYRLEDYITGQREPLPPRAFDDIEAFIETLLNIVSGEIPLDSSSSAVVRKLPPKLGFDMNDIRPRDVEIMLVMSAGAQTRFVQRELQQCGYRVTIVGDTFEALPLIIHTKPDMVIISAMMPEFDGLELAVGLSSMPATRNIPLAIITSMDPDDDHLSLVPKKVPIILKGPSFGDDLFKALDNLFLI